MFTIESVYDEVLEFLPQIPNEVKRLKNVIESSEILKKISDIIVLILMTVISRGPVGNTFLNIQFLISQTSTKRKEFDLYNQGVITLDQIDLDKQHLIQIRDLQVQSEIMNNSYSIDKD